MKWYDSELKEVLYRKKQLLYKKFLRKPNASNKNYYNKTRNLYDRMIKTKKQSYIKSMLQESKNNSRATVHEIINQLIEKKKQKSVPSLPSITNQLSIANHFNRYFTSVGDNLVKNIKNTSTIEFNSYLKKTINDSIFFSPTTPQEIKTIISAFKPKLSCGIDDIPAKVIKYLPDNILEVLSFIFNFSYVHGQHIECFKVAKVVPIFKKGDTKNVTIYRPISLLPCFSKILEKITHGRLYNFLHNHKFFYAQQFGFREKHSTELATTFLVSKITNAMEREELTLGIFLDLSKAFDTVNQDILLTKLSHYGIRGLPLNWFKSYLSNRKQLLELSKKLSSSQYQTWWASRINFGSFIIFDLHK